LKVFLSWSGEVSKQVATEFNTFLKVVIQSAKPWMSEEIPAGAQWFSEIMTELGGAKVGVLFVTNENMHRPWLLFEAGAIANGLGEGKVCAVLIDCKKADIEPPLAQFQLKELDYDGVLGVLHTINNALEEPLDDVLLKKAMNAHWPHFRDAVEKIVETQAPPETERRTQQEMIAELLDTVRGLDQRIRLASGQSDGPVWRALFRTLKANPGSHLSRYEVVTPRDNLRLIRLVDDPSQVAIPFPPIDDAGTDDPIQDDPKK
jgi:hypothetical protein